MGDPLSYLDDLLLSYNNRNACKGGVVCPNIKNSLMNYSNISCTTYMDPIMIPNDSLTISHTEVQLQARWLGLFGGLGRSPTPTARRCRLTEKVLPVSVDKCTSGRGDRNTM